MAIQIVFETHSITEDNQRGIATGWLSLEQLATASFTWQAGWEYSL